MLGSDSARLRTQRAVFQTQGGKKMLIRHRGAEPVVDVVAALDDHSEGDERIDAPARRHFPDEAEPPALLAVAEKVLAADVSEVRAIRAMEEFRGSDVPRLLEAVADAARTKEARLESRRSSRDAWPESRVALAFASEVLRIFR